MFSRLIPMAVAALFGLAVSASAITINPGSTYQGSVSFGPDNLSPASCCPVVPGSTSFNGLQQYYFNTGPMAVGTTITAKLLDLGGNLLSQVTWGPNNFTHNGNLGLGLGLLNPNGPIPASGLFQITASGAPVVINSVQVAAVYNATVTHPTIGQIATQLQSANPVTNLALLQTTPNPTPVPLPAPMLLLLAGLTTLWGLARGKRNVRVA